MFTITDQDRKLRQLGQSWKVRCELGLAQDHPANYPMKTYASREEEILESSLKTILRNRTELLRLVSRKDDKPLVAVVVSQKAIEEAMAGTRMKVMSEQNVRKLIHRYVSEDFVISQLNVNFEGGKRGLTVRGHNYTSFFLSVAE